MKFSRTIMLLLLILFTAGSVFPQLQKGTRNAHREGVHRGNQVRTIFTNYGAIGQPGSHASD